MTHAPRHPHTTEGLSFATLVAALGALCAVLGGVLARADSLRARWDTDAVRVFPEDLERGWSGVRYDLHALLEEGWHPLEIWQAFGDTLVRAHRAPTAEWLAHLVVCARLSRERAGAVHAYTLWSGEILLAGLRAVGRLRAVEAASQPTVYAPP